MDHKILKQRAMDLINKHLITLDPSEFRHLEYNPAVKFDSPNFSSFYSFFIRMMCCAKKKQRGEELRLEIRSDVATFLDDAVLYAIYDEEHQHPIFKLEIQEAENWIKLSCPPF